MSLVHFLTLAALVWMSTRRDLTKPVVPLLVALTLIASYKASYVTNVHMISSKCEGQNALSKIGSEQGYFTNKYLSTVEPAYKSHG